MRPHTLSITLPSNALKHMLTHTLIYTPHTCPYNPSHTQTLILAPLTHSPHVFSYTLKCTVLCTCSHILTHPPPPLLRLTYTYHTTSPILTLTQPCNTLTHTHHSSLHTPLHTFTHPCTHCLTHIFRQSHTYLFHTHSHAPFHIYFQSHTPSHTFTHTHTLTLSTMV